MKCSNQKDGSRSSTGTCLALPEQLKLQSINPLAATNLTMDDACATVIQRRLGKIQSRFTFPNIRRCTNGWTASEPLYVCPNAIVRAAPFVDLFYHMRYSAPAFLIGKTSYSMPGNWSRLMTLATLLQSSSLAIYQFAERDYVKYSSVADTNYAFK